MPTNTTSIPSSYILMLADHEITRAISGCVALAAISDIVAPYLNSSDNCPIGGPELRWAIDAVSGHLERLINQLAEITKLNDGTTT